MKGLGISVPPLHAGVRFDLERLLAEFKTKNSVRFEAFAECFNSLKMADIFRGRQNAAELLEFEEHLLQLCCAYMMSVKSGEIAGYPERFEDEVKPEVPEYERANRAPEHLPNDIMGRVANRIDEMRDKNEQEVYKMTLVERMFGIYCCYSFFYLQPKGYEAQIRISPAQLRDVMDFLEGRLRSERHLDTMACLYKLVNDGAFRICAFELVYDPACHKRYEAEDEDECCLPPGADTPLERMAGLKEDRVMQQLEVLHARYERAKAEAGFQGVTTGEIDLTMSAERILENVQARILLDENKQMMEASRGGAGGGGATASAAAESSSRLDIKQKAYASGVTASRHRRYAFADGDETMARQGEGSDEDEAPSTSKTKKGAAKKKRVSRKTQRDEKADELLQEMHELGVQGVVRRKNASPRKSFSMADNPDALLNDCIPKRKRINKSEAKNMDPLIRITKSKIEEDADREFAKIMKQLKNN